ncbi:immunoglobulin-like domain-containing protein [Planococcus salinus]|uniref:Bacterial Ig-like domain-containing protein n=1 Tax=Planococcus salinus TaxID=1848460 RepID=A0A3M8PC46_9BACL|nr:immunoglobulin-like domain-containing protein [Planococcus salinus]RNF40780.1 hypothetical protein EEX84_00010 [Planococcus salinus]
MKRLLILLFTLLLVACSAEAEVPVLPDPSPDQNMQASSAGLSIELLESTFDGPPSVIETVLHNDSGKDYGLGDYYHIEINKEGKWYMIIHSDAVFLNNPNLKDYGAVLANGHEIRQVFSIDDVGITLVPGDYRLVKTFMSDSSPFHEISVAAPLTVE